MSKKEKYVELKLTENELSVLERFLCGSPAPTFMSQEDKNTVSRISVRVMNMHSYLNTFE